MTDDEEALCVEKLGPRDAEGRFTILETRQPIMDITALHLARGGVVPAPPGTYTDLTIEAIAHSPRTGYSLSRSYRTSYVHTFPIDEEWFVSLNGVTTVMTGDEKEARLVFALGALEGRPT